MDWKNHLETNPIQKIEKKVEIKVKLPHVNKKTTSEKANFCSNTVLSLYFEIRAKNIYAAKPLAFLLHFLFRRDQNHYSNLSSKIIKMCEQILKNIAGRITETTRRRKFPMLMTKQLQQLLSTLNLHKTLKILRKNRDGIQKPKTNFKKNWKNLMTFFNSTRKDKAE